MTAFLAGMLFMASLRRRNRPLAPSGVIGDAPDPLAPWQPENRRISPEEAEALRKMVDGR